MTSGFQTFADPNGNLWVADGWVAQLRSGVRLPVGSGSDFSEVLPPGWDRFLPAPAATGVTFVGGSGRNIILSGLTPGPSGPDLPIGIFVPGRPDVYGRGVFILTVTGSSAAIISDGTDVVAMLSSGGTAPVGSYVATTYGEDTYNGGSAFTLTAAAEEGGAGTIPSYVLAVSAGTAHAGTYTPSTAAAYAASTDADWTIIVNTDGSADLKYSGTIMATRAAGSNCEAGGVFEANAAGMAAYNSGEPWRAFVRIIPRPSRAGFVYVKLTETAGILTNVEGPFLATALPADTATEFHVPLAQSDGLGGIVQLHTGMLVWPSASAAATAALQYDVAQSLTLAEKRQARLNADVCVFPHLIAWDNFGTGYPFINGFLGSGNPDSNGPNVLTYQMVDTEYDYAGGIIQYLSDVPLTLLVINSLSLSETYFITDSILRLTFIQLVDCSGLVSVVGQFAVCADLAYLEINGGLTAPPNIAGMPLLEQLILPNNTGLPDPPSFASGSWTALSVIDLSGCTHASLTAAKMDTMYSQLDALTINAGSKNLYGNGRYTSASAAARTSLAGKGWTITL